MTHSKGPSEHWLALRRRWQPHRSCTPVRPLPGHYWPSPSSWGLLRPIEGGSPSLKKVSGGELLHPPALGDLREITGAVAAGWAAKNLGCAGSTPANPGRRRRSTFRAGGKQRKRPPETETGASGGADLCVIHSTHTHTHTRARAHSHSDRYAPPNSDHLHP